MARAIAALVAIFFLMEVSEPSTQFVRSHNAQKSAQVFGIPMSSSNVCTGVFCQKAPNTSGGTQVFFHFAPSEFAEPVAHVGDLIVVQSGRPVFFLIDVLCEGVPSVPFRPPLSFLG